MPPGLRRFRLGVPVSSATPVLLCCQTKTNPSHQRQRGRPWCHIRLVPFGGGGSAQSCVDLRFPPICNGWQSKNGWRGIPANFACGKSVAWRGCHRNGWCDFSARLLCQCPGACRSGLPIALTGRVLLTCRLKFRFWIAAQALSGPARPRWPIQWPGGRLSRQFNLGFFGLRRYWRARRTSRSLRPPVGVQACCCRTTRYERNPQRPRAPARGLRTKNC